MYPRPQFIDLEASKTEKEFFIWIWTNKTNSYEMYTVV